MMLAPELGVPAAHGAVPASPPSAGDPGLIREAVDLLARAARPLIVAGSGVFYAGAEEALRRLAEAAGLPVVTPIWDRGAVNRPMPEYLGVIGAASGGPAVLADADLILLIGGRVDYRVGYLRPPAVAASARVVRIDRDPAELNQGVLPDVGILGDPAPVLHQLLFLSATTRRLPSARTTCPGTPGASPASSRPPRRPAWAAWSAGSTP